MPLLHSERIFLRDEMRKSCCKSGNKITIYIFSRHIYKQIDHARFPQVYWSAFWNLAISFVNKLEFRFSACGTTNSQFTTNCEWKCVVFCTILTSRLKSCSFISLNQSTYNYVKLTQDNLRNKESTFHYIIC